MIHDTQYLKIDEYSVTGQKVFGWINRRCKQATGVTSLPFGGISIIVVGDIAQLPPISDKVLYHNKTSGELATEGFCIYHQFDTVVKLTVNERARGETPDQEDSRNMLTNVRNGNTTLDEWNTLLTRTPQQVTNNEELYKEGVKLSFGNEKVAKDNYACLMKIGNSVALIKAKQNNPKVSKLTADDMGCLEPKLLLCEGARVMLTCSLWTEAGLCNGAMETVKHIIYNDNNKPPTLQFAVMIQFDDNYIGPSIPSTIPKHVEIVPVISTSDSLGSAYKRQHLPLLVYKNI